jgi:hypothetical protein
LSALRKKPTTAPTAVPTTKAAMAFDDLVMTAKLIGEVTYSGYFTIA